MNKGADIEAKDNDGETILSRASQEGHEGLIELLLNKGANVKAKNKHGHTILHEATRYREGGHSKAAARYGSWTSRRRMSIGKEHYY